MIPIQPARARPGGRAGAAQRRSQQLLAAARGGDDWAFEELLRLHRGPVYRIALGMLGDPAAAAEVCERVFLRLFSAVRRLPAERSVRAWLRRTTIHRCYDRLRGRPRRLDLKDFMPACMNPDGSVDHTRADEWIGKSLQTLSPRQRAALILTYQQGLSSLEAGEAMGCSPAAVQGIIVKIRRRLKDAVAGMAGGGF